MRIRRVSLIVLVASLLVGICVQAAPTLQGRTRPIRVPGRAPNRESGVNNPGGLSSCNTSLRDEVVYNGNGDGSIYADGFPGNDWVLGIASSREDLSEHIVFWVLSDRNGVVALEDAFDIQGAGADPVYTIFIGSNGRIRGLCLKTVFDAYGDPTDLYYEYYSNYPIDASGGDTAPPVSSGNGDVLVPEQSPGQSPFGSAQSSGGYEEVFYMGSGVIYAKDSNGELWWYRHDGWLDGVPTWAEVNGSQRVRVDTGWKDIHNIFSAGDGVIYGILSNGDLLWFRNDCWYEGGRCWQGPNKVGNTWNQFSDVFSIGSGVIYAISPNGDMWWYRNDGWYDGLEQWASVDGQVWTYVGEGWTSFTQAFPAGDGVIYGIQPNGDLLWYRNDCYYDGSTCWQGPNKVGNTWNQFQNVFAGEQGVVYAISPNGDMWWYRNDGWYDGEQLWAEVNGVSWVQVGNGW